MKSSQGVCEMRLREYRGGDEGGSKLNAHQQVLVVCHVYMYKVPFILQFNFEYMKKEREKLKLSSSKDFFSSQYSTYAGFNVYPQMNYIKRQHFFLKPTRNYRQRRD